MHIEQLEYVIEVAKQGTISKAAKNLHVSHSAISQAISNLEQELGIPIFKRSRTGSTCTEEGLKVITLSYEIMNKIMELKELGSRSNLLKGEIKVSASSIFFSTFLPEALNTFKKIFPDVRIEINESSTEEIINSVKEFKIDIGLIFSSEETFKNHSSVLTSKILIKPKLMVSVSKHSPLSTNKIIHPKEMLNYPLVIRNERFAKEVWKKIFANYGEGNVLFYSNNDEVIKNVIANNMAIGFSIDLINQDPLIVSGDIVPIPYVDKKTSTVLQLMCVQAKNKYSSDIEKEFIKHINDKLALYYINSSN